jgi:RNA polymerase sigma factor (sigma-70 family)
VDPESGVVRTLVENHRRFLEFLERRTGDRATAEDLLQSAFVKLIESGSEPRREESAVAWLYRLLRHAAVDRRRAEATRGRALAGRAEVERVLLEDDPELRGEVCRCIRDLLPTLKPEYAQLLQRVDLEGHAVARAADELGITPNNAGVRLHRARKALLREVQRSCGTCATHGCLDCSCGTGGCGEV